MTDHATDAASDQIRALRESGRLMEEAARLEGMDEFSPFGRWISSVRVAMDAFAVIAISSASEMKNFRREASDIVSTVDRELKVLREGFEEGRSNLNKMADVAAVNVQKQEIFRERELQMTLGRIVEGVTTDLKKEVFEKLRERIPTQEYRFYKEARWSAYVRMIMAGAILMGLGFASGFTFDWQDARVGRFCANHSAVDSVRGIKWCQLTPTPPATAENEQP